MQRCREDGNLIVYLDENWFVLHVTVRMLWSDGTESFCLSGPPPRGKRVVKCHAGKSKSSLKHSLLLCENKLSMPCRDYHDDMSGIVFED